MTTKIIVSEEDGVVVGEFFLQQGEHVIGRTADCSIKLKSDHVSREHARLIIGADSLEIEDLDSAWGTYLDDVQIKGRTLIKPTQTLRISDLNFDIERQSLGGVAEDSQIEEEAAEADEVDSDAVEPDKELELDPFAKTEKIPAGKNNEKSTKNTGITVVGVLVLGFLLWFFVFHSTPSAPIITETEIARSVWVSPDSNGSELQWYFKEDKTFIYVESGVASRGSWKISKSELSLKLTNQIGRVNQYIVRKKLDRFLISAPHDSMESELTRVEGSPPIP